MPAKAVKCHISTSPSPEKDPHIWCQLPEDLLERFFALLPLKTLVNLRTICKHFNSLLLSPSFLSLTKTPLLSSFLLSHPDQSHPRFPLYDTFSNRWHTLVVPPSLTCNPHLISTSNGILYSPPPPLNSLLVCNFHTKSTKTIQFPSCPFSSTTLIPSSTPTSSSANTTHGYKIFTLSSPIHLSSTIPAPSPRPNSWVSIRF